MTLRGVNRILYLLARTKTGIIKLARKHRRVKAQYYRKKKNESKTLILQRESRSGASWAVVFAYGSRSRCEKFMDQFPSIPYLILLEVEILAFYTVSQNLHLLTRSEAQTIHTASNHSLRQKQIHGNKGKSKQ